MLQSPRDQEAERVIRSAVLRLFGEGTIERIEVRPVEDHTGEPGLAVTIVFKAPPREKERGSLLLDAIVAASTALRDIDDSRFPYVTFLAPGYEPAEDTRPPQAR
jgi:hypothetical protein